MVRTASIRSSSSTRSHGHLVQCRRTAAVRPVRRARARGPRWRASCRAGNGRNGLAGRSGSDGPYELWRARRSACFIEVACSTMRIEAESVGIAAARDITEREAEQAKLVTRRSPTRSTGLAEADAAALLWGQRRPAGARQPKQALLRLRVVPSGVARCALIAERQSVTLDQGRVSVSRGLRGAAGRPNPEALERQSGLPGRPARRHPGPRRGFEDGCWSAPAVAPGDRGSDEAADAVIGGPRDRAPGARRLLFLEPCTRRPAVRRCRRMPIVASG